MGRERLLLLRVTEHNPPARRETIVNRYLKYQKHLTRDALAQLLDDASDPDVAEKRHTQEEAVENKISLNDQWLGAVLAALKAGGASRVLYPTSLDA